MKSQQNFLTRTSAVVLFGALGLLGVPGTASAAVMVPLADPLDCPAQEPDGGSIQKSAVTDSVTNNLDGTHTYQFRVCNLSADVGPSPDNIPGRVIVDWELPFFGTDLYTDNEAGITDIFMPEGWDYALEEIGVTNSATGWEGEAEWQTPGDPFYDPAFANHTHVLHFYTNCFEGELWGCDAPIFPGEDSGGDPDFFGFVAGYGPTSAPYQASWMDAPVATGDPQFPSAGFPNSPSLNVPEPASLALLATGGLLLGGAAQKRKRGVKKIS